MKQRILNSRLLRSRTFLYALLGLVLAIGIAAAVLYVRNPAGITTIDPNDPPEPILEAAELEKLKTLQSTQDVFLLSGVSPDDSTILVAAGPSDDPAAGSASWLDIQTGELQPVPAEILQLVPQSQVAWKDNDTAVYVSNNANGDPVLVTLERASGEIRSEALPLNGKLLSLAPDGSRVLMEVGSDEGVDLMVSDIEAGTSEKLMSYVDGGSPQAISWTADGSKLAVVRYEISPELAADQSRVEELVMQDALGKLPLAQNPIFTGNTVDVFDLAQGTQQLAALRSDPNDGYLFHQLLWSPDGARLLARMTRPSQPAGREHPVVVVGAFPDRALYRVYDANLALTNTLDRPEIEAPLSSDALFLSPDEVVIPAAYRLNFSLFHFNLLSGEFRVLQPDVGTFLEASEGYQIHATHQSRQLVYNQSSFLSPPEIYRLDLDGGAPQALTHFNTRAADANQVRVDQVSFPLQDGTTRVGYLLQPVDAPFPPQDIPIVLYQQGGPGGPMTNRWGATAEEPFNLLPNFGFAVLFMPFSGREGFGPEFFRALADHDNFGQLDVAEGAQVVQHLLEQGYAKAGGVGIAGCSYGGYFVAQSITQYPDLYDAANVQCAVLDMVKWWEPNPYLVTFMEGSLPEDQPEEYRRDSPFYQASQVTTPLLLFHGSEDDLPFGIVRDFRNGIDEEITPVEMLVFKNEGHSLTLSSSRLVAAQELIAWFRKYLVP
ncbi:MAG TPA: prolyl oligopeptidase family serine peptidase [Anaerolineales bacterium]|nr:prolyl oligopeptidase family serine peptidase [Anaerolineales bacterium]